MSEYEEYESVDKSNFLQILIKESSPFNPLKGRNKLELPLVADKTYKLIAKSEIFVGKAEQCYSDCLSVGQKYFLIDTGKHLNKDGPLYFLEGPLD